MMSNISNRFSSWLEGLPGEVLLPAIILACSIWLVSLYLLARRRMDNGV